MLLIAVIVAAVSRVTTPVEVLPATPGPRRSSGYTQSTLILGLLLGVLLCLILRPPNRQRGSWIDRSQECRYIYGVDLVSSIVLARKKLKNYQAAHTITNHNPIISTLILAPLQHQH
jgi:hypothetical protein